MAASSRRIALVDEGRAAGSSVRARIGESSSGAAVRTVSRAEATLSAAAAAQRQRATCGARLEGPSA
jgi:hypothetical protein